MPRRHFEIALAVIARVSAVTAALCITMCSSEASDIVRVGYGGATGDAAGAYIFAGKQLGFFSEQGVDLQIQSTVGSVGAAGFVASGVMEVGMGGIEAVPGFVEKGVPMKAVYVIAPHPTWELAFLSNSKIQTVAELKGARIGVVSLSSGAVPMLQYILKKADLKLTDVHLLPLGKNQASIAAIKSGQVDALMYDDTGRTLFSLNGIAMNEYSDPQLEAGYPGSGVYMLTQTIATRRATIEAFLRGLTKSLQYATADPDGAVAAYAKAYPEVARDQSLEQALWRARAKISVPPQGREWGFISDEGWQHLIDVQVQSGVLKKDLPVRDVYTTELLTAANSIGPGTSH